MNKIATLVKPLDGYKGKAALYKLSEPLASSWGLEQDKKYEHVVVSSVVTYSGPETLIFGADESGDVYSFLELHGSSRGHMDHEQALRDAGYEIAP